MDHGTDLVLWRQIFGSLVRLSTVLSNKSIYFKVSLGINIMLRHYDSVEMSY